MKEKSGASVLHEWFGFSLGILTAIALLSLGTAEALAQAGIEAAKQAEAAADWAERQKSGSSTTGNYRIISTGRSVRRVVPAPTVSTLKRRPRSGAPGEVSGRLLDRSTGAPLAGVPMLLISTEPEWEVEILDATTDSSGSYRFTRVEPGRWSAGVDPTRLPPRYASARPIGPITVERKQKVTAPDILLFYAGCITGQATWRDGRKMNVGEVVVAPMDTTLYAISDELDPQGQYMFCAAPPGSAMVWLDLQDGRQLGYPARLAVQDTLELDFAADSWAQMQATQVWIQVKTETGDGVGFAEVMVVGRRPGHGERPGMVFLRHETADRQGLVEFFLPVGAYEFLAMNPREGEWGRQKGIEITPTVPRRLTHDIVVKGTSTAAQREDWRTGLYGRADWYLYVWAY
jgi:hypothetical protein